MARLLIVAILLALVLAAPAAAEPEVFVAYGEGNTVCTFWVEKELRDWGGSQPGGRILGRTECNVALEQRATVFMEAGSDHDAFEGDLCSSFGTECESEATISGGPFWPEPAQYRIKVIAPRGQGWLGSPANCSGVGTDNLTCVFQAHVATPWFYTF